MPTAPMIAIDVKTGAIVNVGDTVTSFRGESGTLKMITRAALPGKSGKVIVDTGKRFMPEHYDRVWGLRIVALQTCGCHVDESTHPCDGRHVTT